MKFRFSFDSNCMHSAHSTPRLSLLINFCVLVVFCWYFICFGFYWWQQLAVNLSSVWIRIVFHILSLSLSRAQHQNFHSSECAFVNPGSFEYINRTNQIEMNSNKSARARPSDTIRYSTRIFFLRDNWHGLGATLVGAICCSLLSLQQ